MTLFDLIARNAAERPDAPALLSLTVELPLTHGGLHRLVQRTIATLHDAGIGADDNVVVSLQYGAAAIAATTAIASACRAAPRNAELSFDELATTFEVLRPTAVVVDSGRGAAIRSHAQQHGAAVIEMIVPLDGPAGEFDLKVVSASMSATAVPRPSGHADVAVVYETSGATGRPKQVPLTHDQLLAGASAMTGVLGIRPDDRVVHLAALHHMAGLSLGVLVPLLSGSSAIVAGPFDPERFWQAAGQGATWWNAGPTVQHSLSRAVIAAPDRWAECGSTLRLTRCGGAALAAAAHAELEDVYALAVIPAYGMTETVSQVTSASPLPGGSRIGTAGRPIDNDVRVLTDRAEVAPPGVIGEVQVRGPSVFSGYVGDPSLNVVSFVDGWFRTGDLGHFDDDGFLVVLGRRGEIVNRGGVLVSPAEVDAVAITHPDVVDAAAFTLPHRTLGQEIGLAIVAPNGEPPDLRSLLASRLASQKRPRFVEVVAEIPRTAQGKARRPLLAERVAQARSERPSAEPKGSFERRVAELWTRVTGDESPGRDDDFFLSGGDSLQAITLLALVEDEMGFAVDLGGFLDDPSIRGLAGAIDRCGVVLADNGDGVHTLRGGHGRSPVVLFTGAGGVGITAAPLAARIPDGHHVVTLDAPGLRSGRHPRRIEQLAARHLQSLDGVIGAAPCVLVGYSFGCLIALECARQRVEVGAPAALVLIDRGPATQFRLSLPARVRRRVARVARDLSRRDSIATRRRARVRAARARAGRRYRVGTFSGPTWVLATLKRRRALGADLGWGASLGRPVIVIPIPGDHESLRSDPGALLAVGEAVAAAAAALERPVRGQTIDLTVSRASVTDGADGSPVAPRDVLSELDQGGR